MGPHGVHALEVEHVVDVDVEDPGVRVRGAQHGGVQHLLGGLDPDVVDVAALTAQEALVLDPLDALAHQLGGHAPSPVVASSAARSSCGSWPDSGAGGRGGASPRPSRASSAARSTDRTMFW